MAKLLLAGIIIVALLAVVEIAWCVWLSGASSHVRPPRRPF